MLPLLMAFGLIAVPESAGDAVLYWHGASLTAINYWDVACWLAIALVYQFLSELMKSRS